MSGSVRPHRQPTRLPCPWDSPGTGVGCHFLLQCMKEKSEVAQSRPTLSDPTDCSPPGSSVHGIFQARVLEWGAIAFSDKLTRVYQIILSNILDLYLDFFFIILFIHFSLCWVHWWAGFSLLVVSKVVVVHGPQVAVASCSSLSQGYSFSPLGFNTIYMLKTLKFKISAQTSVLSSRLVPWHHLDVSPASHVELNLPPKMCSSLSLPNSVKQPQSSPLLKENTRRHSSTLLSLISSLWQVLFIALQNIYKFNSSFHLIVHHPTLKTSTSPCEPWCMHVC